MVGKQNKKNLRQRSTRLFEYLDNNIEYKITRKYVGSLARGAGQVFYSKNNGYDLDINIMSKFEDNAQIVGHKMTKLIKSTLRKHETFQQKTRVICINVEENGHKYNFDIAFIKIVDGKLLKILISHGKRFVWENWCEYKSNTYKNKNLRNY